MTESRRAVRSAPGADPRIGRWIARQIATVPLRASSLIITIWGDAIAPHGGAVLLPGLIRLLEPFGINERLVRTSLFRLAAQGWLRTTPVGRRSVYSLTTDGSRRFDAAHRRIYAQPGATWDDSWELVLTDGLTPQERRALATELGWAGFGTFGQGVFARPALRGSPLLESLGALGVEDRVVVVRANDDRSLGGRPLAAAVATAWDLAGVAAQYRALLRRCGALLDAFRRCAESGCDPQQSFVVRTLLLHAYRRALLRDPQLPAALLPLDWPGTAAFALCRDFYRLTLRPSEQHLLATVEGPSGTLPPVATEFNARFGGLAPSARSSKTTG